MKLTIQAKELLSSLLTVNPLCSSGVSLPQLSCVLLESKGNCLTLSANNLDAHLAVEAVCDSKTDGAIAVNCAALIQTVQLMEGEILIEADKKHFVTLQQGSRFRKMPGLSQVEIAPAMGPEGAWSKPTSFESGVLSKALSRLKSFSYIGEGRPAIVGVALRSVKGSIEAMATNGRMGRVVKLGEGECDINLPEIAVAQISKLAKSSPCEMRFSENCAVFRGEGWVFTTKLISDQFPNFRQVIPDKKSLKEKITFDRDEMLSSIRFAALECSEKARSVKFEPSDNDAVLSVEGDGKTRLVVAGTGEFSESVAYNPGYISALIESFEGDKQTLYFEPLDAGVIEDENGIGCVMPMRIA